ncbi:MAG: hypothetical protein Q8M71_10425 [Thermodesulfovibrionales bacterium]|nr:hypothetical protein [Thermodesulfovibrionales bacterium]
MYKKNISAFVWRAIFTLAYTLTVLPFTVNFFKSIASPSSQETLMLIFPLADTHNFALPILLSALEFAAVGLACSLWQKAVSTKKVVILILFLGCQTIPMLSLYYDVRGKDYQAEKKTFDENRKEKVDAVETRIKSLVAQISTLSNEMKDMRKERHDSDGSINQLLHVSKDMSRFLGEDVRAEMRERRNLRGRDEGKINELLQQKKGIESDLKKSEDELQAAQTQRMKYGTQIEYIAHDLLSHKSAFAGFISFLFPLTILSVAFVLPKNSRADSEVLHSFNLEQHLRNAASLPEDMHFNYVKLLVPSLDAYLSALKASKKILNENDALNLHASLIRQIINEVKGLQEQIASSKLEENSKSYMLNELNTLLNQQLTVKEEMNHV